jgi:hypothetical protein
MCDRTPLPPSLPPSHRCHRFDDLVARTGYTNGPHPDHFGSIYAKRDLDRGLVFTPANAAMYFPRPDQVLVGGGSPGSAERGPVAADRTAAGDRVKGEAAASGHAVAC